jgi:hypothetical protein
MTPLRQRMTEDMQLRGLAPATQQAYLRYVEQLALFTGKSPDLATDEDFRQFFLALHPALVAALAPPRQSPSPPLSSSSSTPSNAPGRASTCFVRVPPRPYRSSSALMKSGAFSLNLTTRPTTRVSPPSIPAACGSARASTSRLAGSTARACSCRYAAARASKTAISRCPRTLTLLRRQWLTHRNPVWLFPAGTAARKNPHTATVPITGTSVRRAKNRRASLLA